MQTIDERRQKINSILASYAVPHYEVGERVFLEEEDAERFPFQRDRDRIIHTQAFRRLKHKTQVFVIGQGDHYRTRITHTFEVAQISRDLARALGCNEDLAEAIALAHDLGHTPFGHAGEEMMNACLEPFGFSFEHNQQSIRIVTLLEDRCSLYRGLNLSREILEGLWKHRTPFDTPTGEILRSPSIEAQIVNLADEIAYTAHDTDDGLRAGFFTSQELLSLSLCQRAQEKAKKKGTELRGAIVDILVTDVIASTLDTIKKQKILTLEDVYAAQFPIVIFSEDIKNSIKELRTFLWDRLYQYPDVLCEAGKGQRVIETLFTQYMKHPPLKVQELMRRNTSSLPEAVKDYIAGMTDTFAFSQVSS